MPPPKWSTQLLPPSSSSSNNKEEDDEHGVVVAPMHGIYALCFGHPGASFEGSLNGPTGIAGHQSSDDNNKNKKRKEQSTSAGDTYCGCKCQAELIGPRHSGASEDGSATCSDDSIMISLPLPAGRDDQIGLVAQNDASTDANNSNSNSNQKDVVKRSPKGQTYLTSTLIGRAIFLPKGSKIRVQYNDDKIQPSSSCCRQPSCPLKWRLVLHRELSQSEMVNDSTTTQGYRAINLHPRENESKHLICGECGKKFPSIRGIKSHYMTAHTTNNDDLGDTSIPSGFDRVPAILQRPLEVVYDDEVIAVVVKPQGVSVMGGRPSLARSDLFMALKGTNSSQATEDGSVKRSPDEPLGKPVAVHRLDAPTGGLLVLAKTKTAEIELKKCFKARSCRKRYRAIVFGRLGEVGGENGNDDCSKDGLPSGVIDTPIDGKESKTKWQVIEYTPCSEPGTNGWITTVDLFPETGRKHQLRKHMKAMGCPIWGDKRYGPYTKKENDHEQKRRKSEESAKLVSTDHVMLSVADGGDVLEAATVEKYPHSRLCLYALGISFPHPITRQETTVCMDEPEWYQDLRRQYSTR